MRSKKNENSDNSSQFITFLADFGLPSGPSRPLDPSSNQKMAKRKGMTGFGHPRK